MKQTLFITAITILLFSCSKKEEVALTPTTPPTTGVTFGWFNKWRNDTLKNYCNDGSKDLMFTNKIGDTSTITYNGQKLYIFWASYAGKTFNDSSVTWMNCYVSPNPFDTSAAWSKCQVTPYEYFNTSTLQWTKAQYCVIIHQKAPHFNTTTTTSNWIKF